MCCVEYATNMVMIKGIVTTRDAAPSNNSSPLLLADRRNNWYIGLSNHKLRSSKAERKNFPRRVDSRPHHSTIGL